MTSITLKCPAKVNLHLRMIRKRADGYHDLVTLFHRISLFDKLSIKKRKSGFSLSCNSPEIPTDEANLITKSYRLMQKRFPSLGGVSVHLNKGIPVGAGLGGGSSDAASFLLGLKRLYGLRISQKQLMKDASRLGADIPFFLLGTTQALGCGVGDRLTKLRYKTKHWFLIVKSKQSLSTAEVYKKFKFQKERPSLTIEKGVVRILCRLYDQKQSSEAARIQQNDLQRVATGIQPAIKKTMSDLSFLGAQNVQMTGSGPTVYAVSSRKKDIQNLADEILCKKLYVGRVFICHSF